LKIKIIPILKGQYLLENLENWAFLQGDIYAVVLQAKVTLDQLRIHLPETLRPLPIIRVLEVVHLQGHLTQKSVSLSISVTDPDGKMFGGRLDYKTRLLAEGAVTVAYWPKAEVPMDSFFSSVAAENQ
jgi:predicted DNA-binding protein with PD1-like motif